MKVFLVLVGSLCLMGGIQGQTLSTTVSTAISNSKASLALAIQQVNSTINTADQSVLSAWNQFGQAMIALYTSYQNRFVNYTTVDLSPLANAITNMQSTIAYPPMSMQDGTFSQVLSDVQVSVQQVESTLTAAVANMTGVCATPCTVPRVATCTTKFGPRLSTAPITIDRIASCVSAEQTRYADIGNDISSQYTRVLTSAMNYLMVVNVCDIPPAEALNNPSSNSSPPSTQCLTSFLQRVNSMPMNTYVADSMRFPQLQMVNYRIQRCAKLVELDIKDRVSKVLDSFHNCL